MKIANLSIELTKLQAGIAKTPKGTECLFIPLVQKGISVTKDGKKVYLNFTLNNEDKEDEYGNDIWMYHRQTSEERASKVKKEKIGQGKVVFDSNSFDSNNKPVKPAETLETDSLNNPNEIDSLPF